MRPGKYGAAMAMLLAAILGASAFADDQRIVRPGSRTLYDSILRGQCLLSSGARDEIANLLFDLDSANMRLLADAGVATAQTEEPQMAILASTGDLSSRVPECPRKIIYWLRLQVDILEQVASARGIENDRSYKAHRVLNPETEAVFGDFRDRMIGLLYTPLQEIAAVMTLLDGKSRPRVSMPMNLKTSAELERRYVDDLRLIVDQESEDNKDNISNGQLDKTGPVELGRRSGR
ncbi:MAG: hypothetical protein OEZ32_02535 [Nitrospinota bacterium]|nr:hypothetical protein [Nitrospinota bacterium]